MTTERIDVLAVMDAHAAGIAQAMEGRSARWIKTKEIEAVLAGFREARAAVAELVRTADRVAYALTQDGRTSDGISKEAASNRLRAALAPFQTGEQA